jgi:hypothetical protein
MIQYDIYIYDSANASLVLPSYRFLSPYPTKLFTRKTHLGWVLAPLVYHTMIRYNKFVRDHFPFS